jgi:hypothetical protein
MDAKTNRTLHIRRMVAEAGGPAAWFDEFGAGTKWTPAQVSQWISEKKPKGIGHAVARAIEKATGLDRGAMDAPPAEDGDEPQEPRSVGHIANQLENDVDALSYALIGLVGVLADERPLEGARVAEKIRNSMPKEFVIRGRLHLLLRILDNGSARAGLPSAQPASRRRAKTGR